MNVNLNIKIRDGKQTVSLLKRDRDCLQRAHDIVAALSKFGVDAGHTGVQAGLADLLVEVDPLPNGREGT